MTYVVLSKLAIRNLAAVLEGMDIEQGEPLAIRARQDSGRPYVDLGPPDEYGKTPRLVLDDVDTWVLDGMPWRSSVSSPVRETP